MFNQMQTLEWLIEDTNDNVRYLTAKNILNMPQCSLRTLKIKLKSDSIYKEVTQKQKEDGSVGHGNVWDGTPSTLLLLVQRGFDISDPKIHKVCRHVLQYQDKNYRWVAILGQSSEEITHCYGVDSFLLKTLLLAGFPPLDIRIRKSFAKVVKQQSKDGGWGKGCKKFEPNQSCPYKTLQVIQALHLVRFPQYEAKLKQGVLFLNNYLKEKSHHELNYLILNKLELHIFITIAVEILSKSELKWAENWAMSCYNERYFEPPILPKDKLTSRPDYIRNNLTKEFFTYYLTYFMLKMQKNKNTS
ncbi:hypothetical protein PRVXH_000909 [Proteinivorax hydrogeniformans]|uniref:Squalene cyclase C-terminal domain-containing protein n=1 Tax=Proteinivorax hydrogeniformans TaxID=1826727 RepID=A0AAU8HW04_9FIRM